MNERNIVLEYTNGLYVSEVHFSDEVAAHAWAAAWGVNNYVVHVPFLAPVEEV